MSVLHCQRELGRNPPGQTDSEYVGCQPSGDQIFLSRDVRFFNLVRIRVTFGHSDRKVKDRPFRVQIQR